MLKSESLICNLPIIKMQHVYVDGEQPKLDSAAEGLVVHSNGNDEINLRLPNVRRLVLCRCNVGRLYAPKLEQLVVSCSNLAYFPRKVVHLKIVSFSSQEMTISNLDRLITLTIESGGEYDLYNLPHLRELTIIGQDNVCRVNVPNLRRLNAIGAKVILDSVDGLEYINVDSAYVIVAGARPSAAGSCKKELKMIQNINGYITPLLSGPSRLDEPPEDTLDQFGYSHAY